MKQECPLYGSEECRLLNMSRCEACPVSTGEDADRVADQIAIYQRDTEGVDVPGLFTGEECRLCRNTPKQKAGYMIYDLGHVLKGRKETGGWRKLFRSAGPEYDILLPLQFNCCASCRKHLWWNENLVTVTSLGMLLLAIIPVSIELSAEKLRAVSRLLPILVLAAAWAIGFFGGKLIRKKLSAKWAKETYLRLSEHPVPQTLFRQGWTPVLLNGSGRESVMFTRKPLDRGLGTAPKAEKPVKTEQAGEDPVSETPGEEEKA